ncbi:MAG: hypothetical protein NVSMB6_00660 [Burkholderiaceae bacterium]
MLEAVNSENPSWKRRPHFRHEKSAELDSCSDVALIAAAKACVAEIDEILLPQVEIPAEARTSGGTVIRQTLKSEAVITKVTAYEFVDMTDAVLTLEDGQQIYVRLTASGSVKSNAAKQGPLAEIVIDLSDPVLRTADRATLRRHISLSADHRIWCRNQAWNARQVEAQRLADQAASDYVETQPAAAVIPTSGSYRYSWSASWLRSEMMMENANLLLEGSPFREVLCNAISVLVRQPSESPVDFAIQLEEQQVPREATLEFLTKLHLAVRAKTAEAIHSASQARMENLRRLLASRTH